MILIFGTNTILNILKIGTCILDIKILLKTFRAIKNKNSEYKILKMNQTFEDIRKKYFLKISFQHYYFLS